MYKNKKEKFNFITKFINFLNFDTGRKDRLGNPVKYWDMFIYNKGTANEPFPSAEDILKLPEVQKDIKFLRKIKLEDLKRLDIQTDTMEKHQDNVI